MKTLSRAVAHEQVVGEEVRLPWYSLNQAVSLHTKELVILAGAPGSGKSVVATNLAILLNRKDQPPFPILYFAQDSAPSVVARLVALILGEPVDKVYKRLRSPDGRSLVAADVERDSRGLAVVSGAQTLERITDYIDASTEWIGHAPRIVIIDNLIDTLVAGHHHQETGFYAESLNHLKQLALDRNICLVALHHVTRRGGERGESNHGLGTKPIRMTDLLYSGEREAEHILGVYHTPRRDRVHIQVLKQRDGEADPEGGLFVPLTWHPSLGKLSSR